MPRHLWYLEREFAWPAGPDSQAAACHDDGCGGRSRMECVLQQVLSSCLQLVCNILILEAVMDRRFILHLVEQLPCCTSSSGDPCRKVIMHWTAFKGNERLGSASRLEISVTVGIYKRSLAGAAEYWLFFVWLCWKVSSAMFRERACGTVHHRQIDLATCSHHDAAN